MHKSSATKKPSSQVHPVILVREFRHPDVGGTEQLVLFALASRMQTIDSDVWPSIPTIAADTRASESTVRRAVHRLIELGILVEQDAGRRSRTLRLHLTTGVNLTGQPSNMTPLQDDRDPFQVDRVGCQSERGRGVKLTGEEKEEGPSEAKEKKQPREPQAAHAPPSSPSLSAPPSPLNPTGLSINTAPLTPEAERILSTIAASPELVAAASRGSTPEQLAGNITSAVPGKDPTKKLQGLAKWLRDRPQVTLGAKWLLDKVVSDTDKLPRLEAPKPPPPQPVFVPEPPIRPRPVPLPDEATFIEQQLAGDLRRFTPATLAQLHQVVVEDRARSFEKYGPTTNPIALQVLAWKPPAAMGASN